MTESLPGNVYQNIGDEIGDLLQQAHDWADRTRAEASAEAARVTQEAAATAERLVAEAETKAAQLRGEAEATAERLRSESESTAEQLRSESESTAEQLRSESEERASRLRSESEERAELLRSESESAATKLRANAETYAERVRGDAEEEARRRLHEADARVAELREIETEVRQRVGVLTERLTTIAEELAEEARASGDVEETDALQEAEVERVQPDETDDELRVETMRGDEDEAIDVESESLATEGSKA